MKNIKKDGRIVSIIHEAISHFIVEISNKSSFITVSYVTLNDSRQTATIYYSVFPNEKTEEASVFLARKRQDAHEYLKKHTSLRHVPYIRFEQMKMGITPEMMDGSGV